MRQNVAMSMPSSSGGSTVGAVRSRISSRPCTISTTVDVGFISLNEALDLTTPSGRALAGMLAVFAEFERDILRDRVRAGIAQARKEGKPHGRPKTAARLVGQMRELRKEGVSNRKIAERLGVSRTSVIRLLSRPTKA